ncbi:VOC family protein [Streptomyces sp. S.PB5]|uniref:VOC family protein n=1 Tax=Streptomyces sp. S.PB5 TaxID=3020844 RepID=UPI0025B1E320|nr:VOC family protein [Streptomyces sp. S.PB5]MDN3027489.1 VOC family protein [Streptomyces sp. S.PB5]
MASAPRRRCRSPFASVRGHHTGIRYPDFEATRSFWVDTMGRRVLQVWPYGDLTLAYALPPAQDDFRLEILGDPGATAQPRFGDVDASLGVNGYNHVCLSVDDVDAALEELRARGVDIVNPRSRSTTSAPASPSSAIRGAACSSSPSASATTTPTELRAGPGVCPVRSAPSRQ